MNVQDINQIKNNKFILKFIDKKHLPLTKREIEAPSLVVQMPSTIALATMKNPASMSYVDTEISKIEKSKFLSKVQIKTEPAPSLDVS